MVNERFGGLQLALTSSLRSFDAAKQIVAATVAMSSKSPVPLMDMAGAVQGLIAAPIFNQRLSEQVRSGQVNSPNGFLQKVITTIGQLGVIRPDAGAESAVFALREALTAGRIRTLTYRFGISPQSLASTAGISQKELVKDPDVLLQAIEAAVSKIVTPEALAQYMKQPSIMEHKFLEQAVQVPMRNIGNDGDAPYQQMITKASEYLNRFIAFMTTTFETKLVPKIQDALMSSSSRIFDSMQLIFTQLLSLFGVSEGGSGIERVMNGIVDLFVKGANGLADIVQNVQQSNMLGTVYNVVMGFIHVATDIIEAFVGLGKIIGPTGAALAAFASPAILQNFGSILAMITRIGSKTGSIGTGIWGSVFGAGGMFGGTGRTASSVAYGDLRNSRGHNINQEGIDAYNGMFGQLAKAKSMEAAFPIGASIQDRMGGIGQPQGPTLPLNKASQSRMYALLGSNFAAIPAEEEGGAGLGRMFAGAGAAIGGVATGMAATAVVLLAAEGVKQLLVALTRNAVATEELARFRKSGSKDFDKDVDITGANTVRSFLGQEAYKAEDDPRIQDLLSLKKLPTSTVKTVTPAWWQNAGTMNLAMSGFVGNYGMTMGNVTDAKALDKVAAASLVSASGLEHIASSLQLLEAAIPKDSSYFKSLEALSKKNPAMAQNSIIDYAQNPDNDVQSLIDEYERQQVHSPMTQAQSAADKSFGPDIEKLVSAIATNQINPNSSGEIGTQFLRNSGVEKQLSGSVEGATVINSSMADEVMEAFDKSFTKGVADAGVSGIQKFDKALEAASGKVGTLAELQKKLSSAETDRIAFIKQASLSTDPKLLAAAQSAKGVSFAPGGAEYVAALAQQQEYQTSIRTRGVDTNTASVASALQKLSDDIAKAVPPEVLAAQVQAINALISSVGEGTYALRGLVSVAAPTLLRRSRSGGKADQAVSAEDQSAAQQYISSLLLALAASAQTAGASSDVTENITNYANTNVAGRQYDAQQRSFDLMQGVYHSSAINAKSGTYNPAAFTAYGAGPGTAAGGALTASMNSIGFTGDVNSAANKELFPRLSGLTSAQQDKNQYNALVTQAKSYGDQQAAAQASLNAGNLSPAKQQEAQDQITSLGQKINDVNSQLTELQVKMQELDVSEQPLSFFSGFSDAVTQSQESLLNFAQMGAQVGNELNSSFGTALDNIVMRTQKIGPAFQTMAHSILASMAQIFANDASKAMINSIFGSSGLLGGVFSSGAGSSIFGATSMSSSSAISAMTLADGKADGGLITGGSGTSDDVPAMLTGGEFVINRQAAQNFGYGNLMNINDMQHFADGGVVNGGSWAGVAGSSSKLTNVTVHINGNAGTSMTKANEDGKNAADLAQALDAMIEQKFVDKFRTGNMFNPITPVGNNYGH